MNLKSPLGRLRIVALCEGVSFLLFAITMPLKYMMEMPGPNKVVGMAHGILFLLYIVLAFQNIAIQKWKLVTSLLVLLASVVPFGTFIADAKIFKNQALSPEVN